MKRIKNIYILIILFLFMPFVTITAKVVVQQDGGGASIIKKSANGVNYIDEKNKSSLGATIGCSYEDVFGKNSGFDVVSYQGSYYAFLHGVYKDAYISLLKKVDLSGYSIGSNNNQVCPILYRKNLGDGSFEIMTDNGQDVWNYTPYVGVKKNMQTNELIYPEMLCGFSMGINNDDYNPYLIYQQKDGSKRLYVWDGKNGIDWKDFDKITSVNELPSNWIETTNFEFKYIVHKKEGQSQNSLGPYNYSDETDDFDDLSEKEYVTLNPKNFDLSFVCKSEPISDADKYDLYLLSEVLGDEMHKEDTQKKVMLFASEYGENNHYSAQLKEIVWTKHFDDNSKEDDEIKDKLEETDKINLVSYDGNYDQKIKNTYWKKYCIYDGVQMFISDKELVLNSTGETADYTSLGYASAYFGFDDVKDLSSCPKLCYKQIYGGTLNLNYRHYSLDSEECYYSEKFMYEGYGYFNRTSSIKTSEQNCTSLLGSPDTKGTPAYYMAIVFDIAKYAAIVVLIVFSIMDFVGAVSSHDDDQLKKATSKCITRLVLCVVIFILPTVIEFILQFLNDREISICINKGGN